MRLTPDRAAAGDAGRSPRRASGLGRPGRRLHRQLRRRPGSRPTATDGVGDGYGGGRFDTKGFEAGSRRRRRRRVRPAPAAERRGHRGSRHRYDDDGGDDDGHPAGAAGRSSPARWCCWCCCSAAALRRLVVQPDSSTTSACRAATWRSSRAPTRALAGIKPVEAAQPVHPFTVSRARPDRPGHARPDDLEEQPGDATALVDGLQVEATRSATQHVDRAATSAGPARRVQERWSRHAASQQAEAQGPGGRTRQARCRAALTRTAARWPSAGRHRRRRHCCPQTAAPDATPTVKPSASPTAVGLGRRSPRPRRPGEQRDHAVSGRGQPAAGGGVRHHAGRPSC